MRRRGSWRSKTVVHAPSSTSRFRARSALVLLGVLAHAGMPARAAAEDTRIPVAVLPIAAQDVKLTEAEVDKFTRLLDDVVAESGFRTVPRSLIQAELVEQQKESYRSCYDEACQVELGKAVAAQKIVASTWARYADTCMLSAKLYDLRTELGEVSLRARADCGAGGLERAIEEIGSELRARNQGNVGTFKLDVEEGRSIQNPPTDERGFLVIDAEAQGRPDEKIEVLINGEFTDYVWRGKPFQRDYPVGRYVVILRAPGDRFQHETRRFRLGNEKKRIPEAGTLALRPLFGAIEFRGEPTQATVVLDGEPVSIHGSLSVERRAGRHRVVIEAPGYVAEEPREIEVPAGGRVAVPYQLVRNAGALRVGGGPTGADVFIDGVLRGQLPVAIADLDVGSRLVEVKAPGHAPERRTVDIRRGESASWEPRLREKRARLILQATANVMGDAVPVEADVYLDGRHVGTTPWKDEVRAEVAHRVELRLGNEAGPERDITIPEGREQREVLSVPQAWGGATATLKLKLVKGPWEVRSGAVVFEIDDDNPIRPGRVPLEFFLAGKKVARAEPVARPSSTLTVAVTKRPLTEEELSSDRVGWTWRRWLSLGGFAVTGALGVQQIADAYREASLRDTAYASLAAATTAEAFDDLRAEVVEREGSRKTAQMLGLGLIGAAVGLGAWSTIEWLFGEPDAGRLEGDGIVAVE